MSIDRLVSNLINNHLTDEDIKIADDWMTRQEVFVSELRKNQHSDLIYKISNTLYSYLLNISEDNDPNSTVWRDFIASIPGQYYAACHGYLEYYRISGNTDQNSLIKAHQMLSIFQVLVLEAKQSKAQLSGSKGGTQKFMNYLYNDKLIQFNLIKELMNYLKNCTTYDNITLINYLVKKDYFYRELNSIHGYNHPLEKYVKDCTGQKGKLNLGLCTNGRKIRESLKFALKEITSGRPLGSYAELESKVKLAGLYPLKNHIIAAQKIMNSIK